MEFESSLRVVKNNWQDIASTGKEKQRPKYERKSITVKNGSASFTLEKGTYTTLVSQ